MKNDNIKEFNKLVQSNNRFIEASLISEKDVAELHYNMNPKQFTYNTDLSWYAYSENNNLLEYGYDSPTQLFNGICQKKFMNGWTV